jgi:hypothetical protein
MILGGFIIDIINQIQTKAYALPMGLTNASHYDRCEKAPTSGALVLPF